MNKKKIDTMLKNVLSKNRYQHTISVVEVAKSLAVRYNYNIEKATLAAMLHDCAKNFSDEELLKYANENGVKVDSVSQYDPQLLHGPIGAVVAKNTYGIHDRVVLNAIRYHTTGRKNMSKLDKIIYLADFIEPGRSFAGLDILKILAFEDLDKAVILGLTNTIRYVALTDALIHQQTIAARNDLIIKEIQKSKNRK